MKDEETPQQETLLRNEKEESDRLEHAFRDERIIDKNQDFFQDEEDDDEFERTLREQEAEFTSQGTDMDELECLFKVCSRKNGTTDEIEKARRAFASIQ